MNEKRYVEEGVKSTCRFLSILPIESQSKFMYDNHTSWNFFKFYKRSVFLRYFA